MGLAVDTVILDVDGVIVDVSRSYRRAIVDTVSKLYGETIHREDTQLFKNAGGFNNDWELTYSVALYILARDAGYRDSIETFTADIASAGGGLQGAEAVIANEFPEAKSNKITDRLERDKLRSIFQWLYLGSDRYFATESSEPPLDDLSVDHPGYIKDEPIIISTETRQVLRTEFGLGVLTGRPRYEADLVLDRANLALPPDHVITMDNTPSEKPEPDGLLLLADRISAESVVYVGDTLDDIHTATNADATDPHRSYFGIGVQTGGMIGESGRASFIKADAAAVIESVNDLPKFLASFEFGPDNGIP